ncbi:MAG: hypothetical protein ACRCWG_01100 [Sarcina sp.]
MKKKVLATILIAAGIVNTAGVAFASELNESTQSTGVKVEIESEKDSEENDDEMGVVSDTAIDQLDYAIEDMRIAVDTLEKEGITVENKDYILRFGTQSIERVRPFFDELAGSKETKAHLVWINESWTRISKAVESFESIAGDGTAEDNMGVVSDAALEQLHYAIEEMRIAINTLDNEGVTAENKETILRFGATAIERVRPIFDELQGSEETKGHLVWINESWTRISEAVKSFNGTAGDGSDEDNMEVAPEEEGPVLDGSAEDNMGVDHEVEGPVLDGSAEDNMGVDHEVEGPVLDGSAEDNMGVTPEVEGPVLDGSAEDNMGVTPEVEGPVLDGSAEDNMGVVPEVEGPVLDASAEDNMEVVPEVEAGKFENLGANVESESDKESTENIVVTGNNVTKETNLPNTGAGKAVGIVVAALGLLGITKFAIKK